MRAPQASSPTSAGVQVEELAGTAKFPEKRGKENGTRQETEGEEGSRTRLHVEGREQDGAGERGESMSTPTSPDI